jgi:hypothetical protein
VRALELDAARLAEHRGTHATLDELAEQRRYEDLAADGLAGDGVRVNGGIATGNTISGNSIHSNGGKGIENINGGNMELALPIIDSAGSASGHTDPRCYPCTVEVFSDNDGQGRIYHGSTTTNDDATGTWTYPGAVTGPNITATTTHADGNTSEFSAPVPYSSAVGGIAEYPQLEPEAVNSTHASPTPGALALAGLATGAAPLLAAGGWYARRRWRASWRRVSAGVFVVVSDRQLLLLKVCPSLCRRIHRDDFSGTR